MSATTIVRALLEAVDAGDLDKAAEYLDDHFRFSGPTPEILNKEQWLETHRKLLFAFPDLSLSMMNLEEIGNRVRTTLQMSGTHKGMLDLTFMDMEKYAATGKSFKLPTEHANIVVENGKVMSMEVEVPTGGGIVGILEQLGFEVAEPA